MKPIYVDQDIHKKLKLVSTLSETSIKEVATKILNKSIDQLLAEEMTKYLDEG